MTAKTAATRERREKTRENPYVFRVSRDQVRKLTKFIRRNRFVVHVAHGDPSVSSVFNAKEASERRVRDITGFCRVLNRFKHVDGAEISEGTA